MRDVTALALLNVDSFMSYRTGNDGDDATTISWCQGRLVTRGLRVCSMICGI